MRILWPVLALIILVVLVWILNFVVANRRLNKWLPVAKAFFEALAKVGLLNQDEMKSAISTFHNTDSVLESLTHVTLADDGYKIGGSMGQETRIPIKKIKVKVSDFSDVTEGKKNLFFEHFLLNAVVITDEMDVSDYAEFSLKFLDSGDTPDSLLSEVRCTRSMENVTEDSEVVIDLENLDWEMYIRARAKSLQQCIQNSCKPVISISATISLISLVVSLYALSSTISWVRSDGSDEIFKSTAVSTTASDASETEYNYRFVIFDNNLYSLDGEKISLEKIKKNSALLSTIQQIISSNSEEQYELRYGISTEEWYYTQISYEGCEFETLEDLLSYVKSEDFFRRDSKINVEYLIEKDGNHYKVYRDGKSVFVSKILQQILIKTEIITATDWKYAQVWINNTNSIGLADCTTIRFLDVNSLDEALKADRLRPEFY